MNIISVKNVLFLPIKNVVKNGGLINTKNKDNVSTVKLKMNCYYLNPM